MPNGNNYDSMKQRDILIELANDIRWIKQNMVKYETFQEKIGFAFETRVEKCREQFDELEDKINKNATEIEKRASIFGIITAAIVSFIAVVIRLLTGN